ncbi:hypothetical protein BFJ69_g15100 [Fusarium oxysporum]|uniref:Uncharacterized protein n=1 Tax=Fusarium oxysporum TaxID=5507 RepID=A0A420MFI0_FUSOX|nr:hypothetical protein BFJ69_g15100 [Fusarium oxysporum]
MGRKIRGLVMKQLDSRMEDEDDDDNIKVDPITGEPVDYRRSWNIVWDLQSTHGTRIARQHYAVHIDFPGKLQPEMISAFKDISKLWHQFLEGRSGEEEGGSKGKRRRGDEATGRQRTGDSTTTTTNPNT